MTISLDCGGHLLDLGHTRVMGVLNVTPDSFSDGGRFTDAEAAVARGMLMAEEGAALIDVGGESTRPGATPVTAGQEIDRVVPVIEGLREAGLSVPISVDTSKPAVMAAAVAAGAGMINDVRALQEPGALESAHAANVPVCLMHMRGEPRSMQHSPQYEDVVAEVFDFLSRRVDACVERGFSRERLLVDPGIGFGKNLDHNLSLLRHLDRFQTLGLPVLVGLSRKSMIGAILGTEVDERLYGSLAGAVIAAWQGASILRVHDVRATVEALRICDAVAGAV